VRRVYEIARVRVQHLGNIEHDRDLFSVFERKEAGFCGLGYEDITSVMRFITKRS
jgi:hypothetical protein